MNEICGAVATTGLKSVRVVVYPHHLPSTLGRSSNPLLKKQISFELEPSPFGFNLLGVWCIPKNNRHTQFKIQIKAYIILAHLYHCLVDTVLIWLNQTKNVLFNLKVLLGFKILLD